ncbi:serine/threonine protein kinase [bacterium]|nr:serine/threonine protein kinase [bacterium]
MPPRATEVPPGNIDSTLVSDPPSSHASRPPDSLPSAIPIPAPLGTLVPKGAEETKRDMVNESDPGFTPFVLDNYEVLAPIGKGGMGSVYRARQRSLDRLVAIKILTQANEDQRVRFDREIKATAALNHPNIVKVIGGGVYTQPGEPQGRPYFAMEYVLGRDLGRWAREAPRSAGLCAAMTVTLCDAMHYAHNRGIIHRDLKPQNVLVTNDGDIPKICDFGLAKVAESNLTRTGDVMGTPQYMPPEQILGDRKKIGPPSDVYGLGAILYHLLAGTPPFHSKKIFALTAMVVKDPPAPLRAKNPSVPAALEAIVLKALEKDPVARFHTARDFGRALAGLNLPR